MWGYPVLLYIIYRGLQDFPSGSDGTIFEGIFQVDQQSVQLLIDLGQLYSLGRSRADPCLHFVSDMGVPLQEDPSRCPFINNSEVILFFQKTHDHCESGPLESACSFSTEQVHLILFFASSRQTLWMYMSSS